MFLQFIKKKGDGTWEKLSSGEGKKIKCNLEEMIMILHVLENKQKSWSTVHQFKEEKTPISVNWDGDTKLWFKVGDYPKMLTFTQIELLKRLLEHILQEKIEYATSGNNTKKSDVHLNSSENKISEAREPSLSVIEEIDLGDNIVKITGCIKGETPKALLITIDNGSETWFPKSVIKSPFDGEDSTEQSFLVDSWFLEKNKIGT